MGLFRKRQVFYKSEIVIGSDGVPYEKFADGTRKDLSENIPFELPQGWAWARLKYLGEFVGGHTPSLADKTNWENGSVLWVTSKDMKQKYVCDTGYKLSQKGASGLRLLPVGTLLMVTRSGILRRTFPIALAAKELTINQDQRSLIFHDNAMGEFVYDVLKGMESQILKNYRKTGTTVESIIWERFVNLLIPLPPLAEQKRIVTKVEELFAYADRIGEAAAGIVTTAQRLDKKILDLAIRGQLVPQDPTDEPASELLKRIRETKATRQERSPRDRRTAESVIFRGSDRLAYETRNGETVCIQDQIPFDIPDSWEWVRLGEIFQHNTGKALNRNNVEGTPREYITTSNVYWDEFKLEGLRQMPFTDEELTKCTIQKGDLLVCEGGDIGRAAIWSLDRAVCIQNHLHRLRPFAEVCVQYFCLVLRMYKASNRLQGKGIGLQGFSSGMVHNLLVPIPPLAEQKRIVAKVEQLKSMTADLKIP